VFWPIFLFLFQLRPLASNQLHSSSLKCLPKNKLWISTKKKTNLKNVVRIFRTNENTILARRTCVGFSFCLTSNQRHWRVMELRKKNYIDTSHLHRAARLFRKLFDSSKSESDKMKSARQTAVRTGRKVALFLQHTNHYIYAKTHLYYLWLMGFHVKTSSAKRKSSETNETNLKQFFFLFSCR
jgi:hypothetical protein